MAEYRKISVIGPSRMQPLKELKEGWYIMEVREWEGGRRGGRGGWREVTSGQAYIR